MPFLQIKDASFTTYVAKKKKKIVIFAAVNEKATYDVLQQTAQKIQKAGKQSAGACCDIVWSIWNIAGSPTGLPFFCP